MRTVLTTGFWLVVSLGAFGVDEIQAPLQLRCEVKKIERTTDSNGVAVVRITIDHRMENRSSKDVVVKIQHDFVKVWWSYTPPEAKPLPNVLVDEDGMPVVAPSTPYDLPNQMASDSPTELWGPILCCGQSSFRSLAPQENVLMSTREWTVPVSATSATHHVVYYIRDDGQAYGFHGWTGSLTSDVLRVNLTTNLMETTQPNAPANGAPRRR